MQDPEGNVTIVGDVEKSVAKSIVGPSDTVEWTMFDVGCSSCLVELTAHCCLSMLIRIVGPVRDRFCSEAITKRTAK